MEENYETTDSENSNNQEATFLKSHRSRRNENKSSFAVKRSSMSSGSKLFQSRVKEAGQVGQLENRKGEESPGTGILAHLTHSLQTMPPSMYLLTTLISLLILLFLSSTYLVMKLDNIQEKVEFVHPAQPVPDWHHLLHTQSAKRIQDFLNTNLEQISQVKK